MSHLFYLVQKLLGTILTETLNTWGLLVRTFLKMLLVLFFLYLLSIPACLYHKTIRKKELLSFESLSNTNVLRIFFL